MNNYNCNKGILAHMSFTLDDSSGKNLPAVRHAILSRNGGANVPVRQPFPSVIIPPPGEDNSTNSRKAILNPAYPLFFHNPSLSPPSLLPMRKLSSESLPLVPSSRLFRPPSSSRGSPSLANLLSSVKPLIRDCWP